ncbi:hypothetical protein O181_047951 [Austropuccinia psidii MF-1]|uniref:Uncharacterized protein n=1 Tax=Austropuccinia psidii MF-1 TaxID=1389203 RepID=A0A9Q3DX27_9BASI|nr:hypothetical protein [Austropuccinia psidii MF-1]
MGNQLLTLKKKVKCLGITLTPTLTPGEHLKDLKKCFRNTFAQLNIWAEPKGIKTTDICCPTHADLTWQYTLVHNKHQEQGQQASQHMEP